jgi:hypothetical protein
MKLKILRITLLNEFRHAQLAQNEQGFVSGWDLVFRLPKPQFIDYCLLKILQMFD